MADSQQPLSLRERYRLYLQSRDWKRKRARKLRRTRKCAICGQTRNLDVHHLNYRNWYDVTMADLRVLCRRCHGLSHELEQEGAFRFRSTDHNHRFEVTRNAVA